MGVQFFLDLGSFTVFAALIGRMGDVQLAANQVAITLMSTSFMPLHGISLAATTLVGQYIGKEKLHFARKSGYTAIKMGVAYTCIVAIVFATVPGFLFSALSTDREVIRLGRSLLLLVAIFQLLDGFEICAAGAPQRGRRYTFHNGGRNRLCVIVFSSPCLRTWGDFGLRHCGSVGRGNNLHCANWRHLPSALLWQSGGKKYRFDIIPSHGFMGSWVQELMSVRSFSVLG